MDLREMLPPLTGLAIAHTAQLSAPQRLITTWFRSCRTALETRVQCANDFPDRKVAGKFSEFGQ